MAVAARIVHREIGIDRELLVAMARVALDRLGDSASARIRLHPEDYAAVQRLGSASVNSGAVQVVSDPALHRGGCVVESDFGLIDISVDAQVEELTRALLSEEELEPVPVHALTGNAIHANN
jgi:flagellar assembly protein FliH